MFSFKESQTSLLKDQLKFARKTNSSVNVKASNENDNLVGIMQKNSKLKLHPSNPQFSAVNSNAKLDQQPKSISKPDCKSAEKKKAEKLSHGVRKKIKTETPEQESKAAKEVSPHKKPNKFKSMFPKTYICKYCCRRYHSLELLKQHTNTEHANKQTHVCHLCNHQAASFSALMTHYLKHSGNKKDNIEKIYAKSKADFSNIQFNIFSRPKSSFQCDKCNLTFSSKSKYNAHNCSEIPPKTEYNCAYCRHISTTVEDYRNHIQTHSETPFVCSYCKYKAMTKKQLDSHRENCKVRLKSIVYKCEKCKKFSGKSKKELNNHLKTCDQSSPFTCSKCQVQFEENELYENHLLVCKGEEKPIKKTFTKKLVKSKKKLKESSAEKNKLLCCVCDFVCQSKSEHEEHERQCLAEMAEKSIDKACTSECSNCDSLIEKGKFTEHVKSCTNQNHTDLGKRNASKNNLNTRRSARLVHRKSSFGDDDHPVRRKRSFIEEDFSFLEKSSPVEDDHPIQNKISINENKIKKPKILKIKIQKKAKILIKPKYPKSRKGRQSKNINNPYLCNYCDFTFCSKSTLLRHKRMHSGNPWYICQYCGKFFFRKDVYIRHEDNVHKKDLKSVFCCYYCKLCFNESSLLREHVVSTHKDSAFLPIKRNISEIKKDVSPKRKIRIKKEPGAGNSKNEASESKMGRSPNKKFASESDYLSFKCNKCFETFSSASDLEKHMHTHTKLLSNNESEEISKFTDRLHENSQSEDKSSQFSKIKKSLCGKKSTDVTNKLIQDSGEFSLTSSKNEDDVNNLRLETHDEIVSNQSNITGQFVLPPSSSEVVEPQKCKLCSMPFSTKKLFRDHNKTPHKIVDWYQCLVCTANGPKREMLEHMLMHMYKVGSFVIGSSSDFDKVLSSLQVDTQRSEEHTSISNNEEKTAGTRTSDLVCDEDLPPLREFGICPCLDSSSKQRSNDEIVSTAEDVLTDVEQIKDIEKFQCFQTTPSSSNDINNENKESELEAVNLCIDNTSVTEGTRGTCDESVNTFEQKDLLKEEESCEKTGMSKVQETISCDLSSSIKESNPMPELNAIGNSEDYDQTENFSQLRYLLQSPSKKNSSESKIPGYPMPHLQNSSLFLEKQNLPRKLTVSENSSLDAMNLVIRNDTFRNANCDYIASEGAEKICSTQENNPNINTCLKFDINQSRGEFSENAVATTSNQKFQNYAEMNKNENLFKASVSQSTILDFSDLIQNSFETSSITDDNIFSYAAASKLLDSHTNINMRDEVRTPDWSDIVNNDSAAPVKCEHCNAFFVNYNEKINHKCSFLPPKLSPEANLFQYKSKTAFQSLNTVENQNKTVCVQNVADKKGSSLLLDKTAGVFVCNICEKIYSSEAELLRHQQTEHVTNISNPPPLNECTKCHRTFDDIGELMKHSLTCLRTYFLKTPMESDSITSEALQMLLKKDESRMSFSNLSLNSLTFNYSSTDSTNQASEKLPKPPFNS